MKFKLTIRGRVASVGTWDHCLETVMRRWGWVPMRFAPLLRAEIEPA